MIQQIRELFSLLGDIGGTIALVTTVVVPIALYAWRRFRGWRVQRSRRSLLAEIERIEVLSRSPSMRAEMMQQRLLWLFVILGVWMMSQAVGRVPKGSQELVAVADWLCGGLCYMIALQALGWMKRLGNADQTLKRLRDRLDKLPGAAAA